ncbi:hypothetical protein SNE40_011623 [Patella caerulea]|uniref:Uncharacterized protein n=1 Tax=Patella caerulea TaxID=87958 RepID=A0AAN8JPQ1_PATCE
MTNRADDQTTRGDVITNSSADHQTNTRSDVMTYRADEQTTRTDVATNKADDQTTLRYDIVTNRADYRMLYHH